MNKIDSTKSLYEQNIQKGLVDYLREEILKEIIKTLYNSYNSQMGVVPCRNHLIKKSIQIEKTLFKKASVSIYMNVDIIRNIVKGLNC